MRVRTQRTHFMGVSNRNANFRESKMQLLQRSDVKSKSFAHPYTQKQFYSTRFPLTKASTFTPSPNPQPSLPLDKSPLLNQGAQSLQRQFKAKAVNMQKIEQLKHTFIRNNARRKDLNSYFMKYARDGVIDREGLKSIVREYGYCINDDQASLMIKLSHGSEALNIQQFVELMAKENVLFKTLDVGTTTHLNPHCFSTATHTVLNNKINQLREAFHLYQGEDVDESKYCYVMKKLDITNLVLSEREKTHIFKSFLKENNTFDVEKFLGQIAVRQNGDVKLQQDKDCREFKKNIKVNEEIMYRKNRKPVEYSFKRLSVVEYQRQLNKAQQVLTYIRKYKDEVSKYLGNQAMDKQLLRQRIEQCLMQKGMNFQKTHYDSLLSYVDYDANDKVRPQELKKYLFTEDRKQAMERFERRLRVPPPLTNIVQQEHCNEAEAIKSLEKIKNVKLQENVQSAFNKFDSNKDGYVSRDQLEENIHHMHILNEFQTSNLINYLDPQSKGYLTYDQFASKYYPSPQRVKESRSDWLQSKKCIISQQNAYVYNAPSKYSAWPSRLQVPDLRMIQPTRISDSDRFAVGKKHEVAQEAKQERMKIYANRLKRIASSQEATQERIAVKMKLQQERQKANNYTRRLCQSIYQLKCHE